MKSTQRGSLEEGGNISSRSSKLTLMIPFVSLSRFRKIKILLLFFTIINRSFFLSCADINIESPPSTQPCKRICDVTGFEVCITNLFLIFDLFFSLIISWFGLVTGAICRPQNKPPLCKCSCFQGSKVTLHPPSPPLSLHSQCRSTSQVASPPMSCFYL